MIDIRNPSADELRAAMAAGAAAFGEEQRDEDFERHRRMLPLDRFFCAYDDGRPVGTGAAFSFDLTVPGGVLPAAGVTWIGVLPSHRRRGILTELMRRLHDDARARGEPLAVLWASESAIYGRFGYGMATANASLEAEKERFGFRDDPGATGTVRLVHRDEALELFPPVYERVRGQVPGMLGRSRDWWQEYRLADPEHWRRGAGPKFYAALEVDGEVEAYAFYRIKSEWEHGIPKGCARVIEAIATSTTAARELWRFLFGIDLISRVDLETFDAGSPLFLMVVDARRLHLRLSDGLWLRILDAEAALGARSYTGAGSVVLELRDELCPWNAGCWRVGPEVGRTDAPPELELHVRDLGSAYLGAFGFEALAAAERVRELKPGAVERASALFRTSRPPYCPEEF